MKTKLLLSSILLSLASVASADQCAYISEQEAKTAMQYLQPNDQVVYFCELCGDKIFQSEPIHDIKTLSVKQVDENDNLWEISVNGKGIDLAYTYLDTGHLNFVNMAVLSGCEAQGMTPHIKREPPHPRDDLNEAS